VVAAPLDVAVGETVPHGVAGQVTVQVTPLFAESLETVAVICAVAPACTEVGLAMTETVIGRTVMEVAPVPPPHPELFNATSRAISVAESEM